MPEFAELSPSERIRYSRHLILPEVGMPGQLKMRNAKVLIVGAGGLGSPVALYLTAAGIGQIGLVDFDNVDASNLQRQVLYTTDDVKKSKVERAEKRLLALNPDIAVKTYSEKLTAENALGIISNYDVVVDGTDNFATRYLVNDACVLSNKPNVYGSIFRFEGQVSVFHRPGPCYRCLFPDPPPPEAVPNCAEGGVLGVLAGTIGTLQATEVIKLILGIGESLIGRLALYNALDFQLDVLTIRRKGDCPICGDHPRIRELREESIYCAATGDSMISDKDVTPSELKAIMDNPPNDFLLLDVRSPQEYVMCNLPNAVLIPVDQLQQRLNEVERERDIVVYCRSGVRSAHAAQVLRLAGYKRVRNLLGGIMRWAQEVDPTLPVA